MGRTADNQRDVDALATDVLWRRNEPGSAEFIPNPSQTFDPAGLGHAE
jgi:hypothetical protein